MHVVSSREQDWTEQEVSVESSPTIIYQEVSAGESQSATSTIKALLELQQTTGELLCHGKAVHTLTTAAIQRQAGYSSLLWKGYCQINANNLSDASCIEKTTKRLVACSNYVFHLRLCFDNKLIGLQTCGTGLMSRRAEIKIPWKYLNVENN